MMQAHFQQPTPILFLFLLDVSDMAAIVFHKYQDYGIAVFFYAGVVITGPTSNSLNVNPWTLPFWGHFLFCKSKRM